MGINIRHSSQDEESPSTNSDKSDSFSVLQERIQDSEFSISMLDRETDATDYEGERLDRDYDARQALHFRRGLLGHHTADFRRNITCTKDHTTWNVRCRVLGGGGQFFFPLEPSLYIRRPVHRVFLNLRKGQRSAWTQKLPLNWRDIDIRISFSREFAEEMGMARYAYPRSELQDQLGRDELNAHVAELSADAAGLSRTSSPVSSQEDEGGRSIHVATALNRDPLPWEGRVVVRRADSRRRRRNEVHKYARVRDVLHGGGVVEAEDESTERTTEIVHKSVTPQGIAVEFEYKFKLERPTDTWQLVDVIVILKSSPTANSYSPTANSSLASSAHTHASEASFSDLSSEPSAAAPTLPAGESLRIQIHPPHSAREMLLAELMGTYRRRPQPQGVETVRVRDRDAGEGGRLTDTDAELG